MLSYRDISERLETISPYSAEELVSYSFIIEKELEKLNETLNKTGSNDYSGAALLAAARANYKIALIRRSGNSVTSFAAGDVRISENNSELENAKALLDEVSSECAALADVNGFAFRTV